MGFFEKIKQTVEERIVVPLVKRFNPKLFRKERNAKIQKELNRIISDKTKAIAKLDDLDIDSDNKKLSVHLHLVGESEPIQIEIGKYKLWLPEKNEKRQPYVELAAIEIRKEWLKIVINEFLESKGGRVLLPISRDDIEKLRNAEL